MREDEKQTVEYLGSKGDVGKGRGCCAVAVAEEGPAGKESFPEHPE